MRSGIEFIYVLTALMTGDQYKNTASFLGILSVRSQMNDLAVLLGLISFPGLIATILCDKLLVHAERWNSFKYGIYTFVFGIGSYVLLQFVVWIANMLNRHLPFLSKNPNLNLWITLTNGSALNFTEVAWATSFSPIVALFAVYFVNKKIVTRFGQKIRISNKYGDENLLSYFLNSPDIYWVYIRDPASGLSYRGAVRSFSETKEVQEVLLTNVTVYNYSDSEELYQLSSIYLSKPLGSFIIESPISISEGGPNVRQDNPSERGRGTGFSDGRRAAADK